MGKLYNQESQNSKRKFLRKNATRAEKLLWQGIRKEQLGVKFRRQFSVGFFVLDFYCPELKLAIEVDGYSHDSEEAKRYDAERQKIIEVYGVRFFRVRDERVNEDPDSVLVEIKKEIGKIIPAG